MPLRPLNCPKFDEFLKWKFVNLIFGFLAEFWVKFWCNMFLCVKANQSYPWVNIPLSHQFQEPYVLRWYEGKLINGNHAKLYWPEPARPKDSKNLTLNCIDKYILAFYKRCPVALFCNIFIIQLYTLIQALNLLHKNLST